MRKKISLIGISFAYTLLFGFVLDGGIFIDDLVFMLHRVIYGRDIVGSSYFTDMTLLFCALLLTGAALLTIRLYERIQGFFVCLYIPSLLASFLLALFFDGLTDGGVISLPWYFVGTITLVGNLLLGPAMIFLLCYSVLTFRKRRNKQR